MPVFRVFSEDALDAIHSASLEVLEKTGVRIHHGESILKMLKDNGCTVDFEKGLVRFPSYIVEEAVKKTPKTHPSYGRNPNFGLHASIPFISCPCKTINFDLNY